MEAMRAEKQIFLEQFSWRRLLSTLGRTDVTFKTKGPLLDDYGVEDEGY